MKQKLVRLLTEPNLGRRIRLFEGICEEIRSHVCPVRPDRSYVRNRDPRAGRYHNTHKRCY
ncbi:hypothetical protein D2E24_1212 [Bifidobacterium samirii]|uniref:Uncharacterized protein n=1 Tax=Bifidobacterium samirii TaxID=2306974 RepID=A0A430FTJ8_9BIFI|nr:hypothetical protein D2E24_1212 [Bifidobacterium samirii]